MKLYKDIFSGEEIITDSFNIKYEFNNVIGKIQSKYILAGGVNVDIGAGNAFGGGGEDEQCDDQAVKVLDVLDAFKYNETTFDKKSYTAYIKGYMKRIKEKLSQSNPDRIDEFMKGAAEAVKFIIKNFNEFSFYIPESYDAENTIILSYYDEGAETPYFLFFMDGLKGQNC